MKLLLITTTYPTPARPRQGAFNRVLVDALRHRHDVRVIAPIPWTQSLRTVESHSEHAQELFPIYYYPPKILRAHYHKFYMKSIERSVNRVLDRFVPDVVLAYWLHPDGEAAVHIAKRLDVPAIVMSGGTDLRLLTRSRDRREAITRVLRQADRAVVFSHELAGRAKRLGLPAEKIDVVYRGIDRVCFRKTSMSSARAQCGLSDDAVVLLWAGRFESVKNPTLLLQAAARWKRVWGNRLHVLMAGGGPMQKQLRRRCKHLGLNDVVSFVGNLSQSELAVRFNAANATVLTSRSEGVPNVLLESIACETPFVATRVGGVPEIATEGIDQLVPNDDVEALTRATFKLIESVPVGKRTFVPTDLAGMAKRMDAVIARTCGCGLPPTPKAPFVAIQAANPFGAWQLAEEQRG